MHLHHFQNEHASDRQDPYAVRPAKQDLLLPDEPSPHTQTENMAALVYDSDANATQASPSSFPPELVQTRQRCAPAATCCTWSPKLTAVQTAHSNGCSLLVSPPLRALVATSGPLSLAETMYAASPGNRLAGDKRRLPTSEYAARINTPRALLRLLPC